MSWKGKPSAECLLFATLLTRRGPSADLLPRRSVSLEQPHEPLEPHFQIPAKTHIQEVDIAAFPHERRDQCCRGSGLAVGAYLWLTGDFGYRLNLPGVVHRSNLGFHAGICPNVCVTK